MTSAQPIDSKYYTAVPPGSLAERMLVIARDRIYADFLRLMRPQPDEDIIDVGVSDVVNDGANLLERLYPHPERITAAGLGATEAFKAAYPLVAYRQVAPHVPLPYADKTFGIAFSNAVLEHLGSAERQRAFIADLARVARRVFLTVPNRHFPVEHHTALPLMAWTDATFKLACRLARQSEWADPANLILMSRRRLAALCPPGRRARIGYTGLPLGPLSSNLYLCLDGD